MRVQASADRVDEVVREVLRAYLGRSDVRAVIAAQRGPSADESQTAAQAVEELAELRRRHRASAAAYADGVIDLQTLKDVREDLEARIARAEEATAVHVEDPKLASFLGAEDLMDAWERSDLMDQRHLLRALFTVTIRRATKRGRTFDSSRVSVTAAT